MSLILKTKDQIKTFGRTSTRVATALIERIEQLEKENAELKTCESNTLTKREQFAMSAMQGYLSGVLAWSHPDYKPSEDPAPGQVAKDAIAYADALIKELEK